MRFLRLRSGARVLAMASGLVASLAPSAAPTWIAAIPVLAPARSGISRPTASTTKPNIVLILTDDMNRADLHSMPGVRRVMTREGMRFTRALVNVSLCCPSRTTILRGQYAHNTGVKSNGGTNGGFETAYRRGVERSTIATWLQRAGYRTGLIGKYLNGYPNGAPNHYRPPGWTDWVTPVKGSPYDEFGYRLEVDGHTEDHFQAARDYGTRVYLHHARRFITTSMEAGKPFFLDLALYAPHRPATPDPRDVGALNGIRLPRPPSFDERDVRDKPRWLQSVPRLRRATVRRERLLFENRRESLRAVDRGVVGLVDLLRRNHQLDNTYLVFTSDNGFHIGQHRLPAGKQTAFEEDIRVPMVVRGPGIAAGRTSGALVGNVDLAPTFAALAGATTPRFVDGRSLVAALRGRADVVPHRRAFLIEHWREHGALVRDPQTPLEPPDNDETEVQPLRRSRHPGIVDKERIPDYEGLRTDHYTYVEYRTGERELYDLRDDPAEMRNAYARATFRTQAALHRELVALEACAGASCRRGDTHPTVDLRWRPKIRR